MIQIPCKVSKRNSSGFIKCQDVELKDFGENISSCVTSLYPNHADSSDNSNLVIVIEKIGDLI